MTERHGTEALYPSFPTLAPTKPGHQKPAQWLVCDGAHQKNRAGRRSEKQIDKRGNPPGCPPPRRQRRRGIEPRPCRPFVNDVGPAQNRARPCICVAFPCCRVSDSAHVPPAGEDPHSAEVQARPNREPTDSQTTRTGSRSPDRGRRSPSKVQGIRAMYPSTRHHAEGQGGGYPKNAPPRGPSSSMTRPRTERRALGVTEPRSRASVAKQGQDMRALIPQHAPPCGRARVELPKKWPPPAVPRPA